MNILTYKECAAYINSEVHDENLKEFVFLTRQVSFKHIKRMGPIYRVLLCSFSLIYLKWLSSTRKEAERYSGKHSDNVFNVLFGLYRSNQLNLDVVIYVLTEAQKDVIKNGESSFFADIISRENFCAYSKVYGLLDNWQRSVWAGEVDEDIILGHFVNVLNNSLWLRTAEYIPENNAFILNGKKLSCRDVIYNDATNTKHILVDRTHMFEKIKRDYLSLDDFTRSIVIGGESV